MKICLTYQIAKKQIPDSIDAVLGGYCLTAKNIYNASLYLIRQVFSAYQFDSTIKTYTQHANLHQNNQDVINQLNLTLQRLNTKTAKRNQNKLIKDPKVKIKDKVFTPYTTTIDSNVYYQILNKTVLENLLRDMELVKTPDLRDYTLVHSHLAQSVLHDLVDNYQTYFKSLKKYFTNPAGYTGRPNAPDYQGKNERKGFELAMKSLLKDGSLIKILKQHSVYKTFPKQDVVTDAEIKKYNAFNWRTLIEDDIKARGLTGKLSTIRITPVKYRKNKVKVEYTLTQEHELKGFYPELLDNDAEFMTRKPAVQLKLIQDLFKNKDVPYLMSLDFGQTNFATVAYYTNDKAINSVISADTLSKRLNLIDLKIDKRKGSLVTPELKLIQTKLFNKEKLTREELRLDRLFKRNIHADSVISKLQRRKNNVVKDYLHKLSSTLINDCQARGIQVITLGKNLLWKDKSNRGVSNRIFHNLPHARFIEILKYKAVMKNILVIETEESYTSKTSFVTDEPLQKFSKETHGILKHQFHGKRDGLQFKVDNKTYHADVNGAMNIARKVFDKFVYDKTKLTMSYRLNELKLSGKKKFKQFFVGQWQTPSQCGRFAAAL